MTAQTVLMDEREKWFRVFLSETGDKRFISLKIALIITHCLRNLRQKSFAAQNKRFANS